MKRISYIYRSNIYGIMGTLAFHILVAAAFLLSEIRLKGNMEERAVYVEIPVEMMEESPEQVFENGEAAPVENRLTNTPSRRSAESSAGEIPRSDRFFDDAYQREVDAARQLSSDVNKQLARKSPEAESVEMPVDNTEGKTREEIKNIVYSGESNVEYHLGNRYHLRLPIPVYLAKGGGIVTVDIVVNRDGRVISAKPRSGRDVTDDQIYQYATMAAEKSLFNRDQGAPAAQMGTIKYTFIPQ